MIGWHWMSLWSVVFLMLFRVYHLFYYYHLLCLAWTAATATELKENSLPLRWMTECGPCVGAPGNCTMLIIGGVRPRISDSLQHSICFCFCFFLFLFYIFVPFNFRFSPNRKPVIGIIHIYGITDGVRVHGKRTCQSLICGSATQNTKFRVLHRVLLKSNKR